MAAPPAAVTRQRREQGGGVLLQQLQLLEGFADAVLAVEVDQVVQRPQARFPVELFADQVDGGLEPLPVSNRLGQQDDHAGVGGASRVGVKAGSWSGIRSSRRTSWR